MYKFDLGESGLDSPSLLSVLIDVVRKAIPKSAFDKAIRNTEKSVLLQSKITRRTDFL